MKIGQLVKLRHTSQSTSWNRAAGVWVGVIVGLVSEGPIVYWNETYPREYEWFEDLELVNESR